MSKDIYVFIEQRDNKLEKVGIELLGKARELADDLGQEVVGMLIGENVKGEALSLIHISEPTRLHKVSRMPSSA